MMVDGSPWDRARVLALEVLPHSHTDAPIVRHVFAVAVCNALGFQPNVPKEFLTNTGDQGALAVAYGLRKAAEVQRRWWGEERVIGVVEEHV